MEAAHPYTAPPHLGAVRMGFDLLSARCVRVSFRDPLLIPQRPPDWLDKYDLQCGPSGRIEQILGYLAIFVTLQKLYGRACFGEAEWFTSSHLRPPEEVKADEHCFE